MLGGALEGLPESTFTELSAVAVVVSEVTMLLVELFESFSAVSSIVFPFATIFSRFSFTFIELFATTFRELTVEEDTAPPSAETF